MLINKNIQRRIEAVMQGDSTADAGWLGAGLSVMAALYGSGVRLRKTAYARQWMKKKRLDCLVVSVGNLALGGTGKTPLTMYLARLIPSYGYSIAIVSRGYKGSAEGKGGVVSDGKEIAMPASACGDEAYMMAKILENIPVVVGQDRYAAGSMALQTFRPQIILLDDGFQHIRLERDIDLVLLDTVSPFANGKLLPRGTLREQKDALQRASAVVLTRAEKGPAAAYRKVEQHAPGKPIFQCVHRPYIADTMPSTAANGFDNPTAGAASGLDALRGRRGYIFSGIARNERFQRTIGQTGVHVCGTSFFEDHHWYSHGELEEIAQSAQKSHAELIITTQKDVVRIPHGVSWPFDLVVVGVEIQFPDDGFDQYIQQALVQIVAKKTAGKGTHQSSE